MNQLVGIAYASRVGKDTAADALVRDLGYRKFAFASALKELALEVNPVVLPTPGIQNVQSGHNRLAWVVRLDGWERCKDRYAEVRTFLENLGCGARTVFGEDFWAEIVMKRVQYVDKAVVSDVRFRNEFDAIRSQGGKLIKIRRPGHQPRPFEAELDEIPDDEWDLVIDNVGSVVDLEVAVVSYVKAAFRTELIREIGKAAEERYGAVLDDLAER